jgi:hypothetical protein
MTMSILPIRRAPISTRIRAIYAVCLVAATCTHAATLVTCGLLCSYNKIAYLCQVAFLIFVLATIKFASPQRVFLIPR